MPNYSEYVKAQKCPTLRYSSQLPDRNTRVAKSHNIKGENRKDFGNWFGD